MNELRAWFAGRSLRERRLILVMVALLAVTIVWGLVIRPVRDGLSSTRERYADAVVRAPADEAGVTGEVWSVDGPCLRALDVLEGVAEGLFVREFVPLAPPHNSLAVQTYLYRRPLEGCRRVGSTWPEPDCS